MVNLIFAALVGVDGSQEEGALEFDGGCDGIEPSLAELLYEYGVADWQVKQNGFEEFCCAEDLMCGRHADGISSW